MEAKTIKSKLLSRSCDIKSSAVNMEDRTVELAWSSEEPVERWFGKEILDHKPKSVRMKRINDGAAMLVNHNVDDQVGKVEKAWIDSDRVARAIVRFGPSARAEEILQDVAAGIRTKTSFMYRVHKMTLESEDEKEGATYRATDWEPFEISLVSIPADHTVGVGRSALDEEFEITIQEKEQKMGDEIKATAVAPVDVDAIRAQAIAEGAKNESARRREFAAIQKRFSLSDAFVSEHIEKGTSLEDFKRTVADSWNPSMVTVPTATLGLPDKDKKNFSLCKAIMAAATQKWQDAGLEKEVCDATRDLYAKNNLTMRGNIQVPFDVLQQPISRELISPRARQQRDLVAGTDATAGYLVGTEHMAADFIALLRNMTVLDKVGAFFMPGLVGDVNIPKQATAATFAWVGENVAGSESNLTVGQLALTPKTGTTFTDISRQLMLQSTPSAEQLVREDLAAVAAIGLDAAGMAGATGGDNPVGVLYTTGVNVVALGTNGAAPTWSAMVDMKKGVIVANALFGSLAWACTGNAWGTLMKTAKVASTDSQMILAEPGDRLLSHPLLITEQLPSTLTKGTGSNLSAMIFGNWRGVIVAGWGGLDLLVNPYTGATAGTVRIHVFLSADIGVRWPAGFSVIKDMITS